MKTTLHGVKSKSTKDFFTELKKKGFTPYLEKGSFNTFKICVMINGVDYVISCIDGCKKKYAKGYSRNKRDWKEFVYCDELVEASLVKKTSGPTDKQKGYLSMLLIKYEAITGKKMTIKYPKTVVDMVMTIQKAKQLIEEAEIEEELDDVCISNASEAY